MMMIIIIIIIIRYSKAECYKDSRNMLLVLSENIFKPVDGTKNGLR